MTTQQKVMLWLGKHGGVIPAGAADELRQVLGDPGYEDGAGVTITTSPPWAPSAGWVTYPHPVGPNVSPTIWCGTSSTAGGAVSSGFCQVIQ